MDFTHGLTITIIRPAGFDDYGDPQEGQTTSVSHGWGFAPQTGGPGTASRDVDARGREGLDAGITGYGPYGVDVRHTDLVDIPSGPFAGTWEVGGAPEPWLQPMSGWEAGTVVALSRKEG